MEPKRAGAAYGPVFVPGSLLSPLSAGVHVLRDLIWALFWKKAHFRGVPAENFKAAQRDDAAACVSAESLQEAIDQGRDPVDATLNQLWQIVSAGNSSQDSYPEQWKTSETTLNARCALGFALLGGHHTTRLLQELVPGISKATGATTLALLNMSFAGARRADFDFGQPDLVLRGADTIWICEMKVRGASTSSCPYSAEQFLKYMTLAAETGRYWPEVRVVHLILGPTTKRRLASNRTGWFGASADNDGHVAVDLAALSIGKFRTRWAKRMQAATYRSELESLLTRIPIRLASYEALVGAAAKMLAPSPVRTQWAILSEAAQPYRRCDDRGRAFAGSQLQVQTFVNRRRPELDAAILALLPDPVRAACITWRSPLEKDDFAEYMDGKFLDALGLSKLRPRLRTFWPRGGPHWDALATLGGGESGPVVGYLLVESKSYPEELRGGGCAAESDSVPHQLIKKSLDETARWAQPSTDAAWLGSLYQYANRLAHVRFLEQESGLPVWLVNLCFTSDPHHPTSHEEWNTGLRAVKRDFGFEGRIVPQCVDVFLPAVSKREELLEPAIS